MEHDQINDERQNFLCSGIHQSGKIEAENHKKRSETLTEDKLQIGSSDYRSDHDNIGSQDLPLLSMKPTEYEYDFHQHRANEELFASDEESEESNRSVSSDGSNSVARDIAKLGTAMKNHSFHSRPLSLIPGFYDCDEKVSELFTVHELLRFRNDEILVQGTYEDVTRQLNQVILNAESSKSSNTSEKDSENLRLSPERSNLSNSDSPEENKQAALVVEKPNSSSPQPSDYYSQIVQSPTKVETIFQRPNDVNQFINPKLSEWKSSTTYDLGVYNMITTPISSIYIDLESTKSVKSSSTFESFHKTDMEIPLCNSPAISFGRLPKRTMPPTDEVVNSPNSKNRRVKLSRSLELSSPSNHYSHPRKECRQSNESSSFCGSIRNKSTTSLTDIPNSSNKSKMFESQSVFKSHIRKHKSSRLLNINDSDTSSDDTKGKNPKKKQNQKRRKTYPNRLLSTRENHSTILKTDNDENVLENVYSYASTSQNYHEQSLKNVKEKETTNCILRSLEIINSENFEPCSSSRKRLVSNSKTSEAEQSCGESKIYKKMRRISSEE